MWCLKNESFNFFYYFLFGHLLKDYFKLKKDQIRVSKPIKSLESIEDLRSINDLFITAEKQQKKINLEFLSHL